MILTCEKCDTSFSFDENLIKSSGSKVRCSKCRHIFLVVPPAPVEGAEAETPPDVSSSGKTPVAAAAGLDDLDLDAIEKSLDLDPDQATEKDTEITGEPQETGLDLNFEEDDILAAADEDAAALESTDELDFDLDLDFDADSGDPSVGDDLASEATEDLDFQLDLDLDDEAAKPAAAGESPAADDLSFDLDLDLDETPETADALSADSDTTDDLDFQLDLDLEENVADLPDSDEPVAGMDFDQEEKSVVADSGVEFDETQELDLSDMNSLLDLGHEDAEESISEEATESLDIDLDFGQDAGTQTDRDETDTGTEANSEDLEFELDLDPIDTTGTPDQKTDVLESTEELDLADLEEMIESGADGRQQADVDSTADDLDFDIDRDTADSEIQDGEVSADDIEVTDDFDLNGLDDLLEIDGEEKPADDQVNGEAKTVAEVLEPDTEESSGEGSLDDMLDLDMEELEPSEEKAEDESDFDLVLDDDFKDEVEAKISEVGEDLDDDDFDLSDLDDMLEVEDGPQMDAAEEDEEFDLDLDLEDVTAADDTREAVLEFELEEEERTDSNVAELAAVAGAATAAGSDGFGMGDLSDSDDDVEEAEGVAPATAEPGGDSKPAKAKKKPVGGFTKTLLVLLLLIGGGYGAFVGAQYLGIDIPYLDKLKGLNIPYISDMIGSKSSDAGNLKITIIEKDVDGRFVPDTKLGMLYVVSGKVRNDYDHSRGFIQITGKLYSKGRKLRHEKTVYAGNVLSDSELAELNQAGIDKILGNRMGQSRSNVSLRKGAMLPFMIVFSDLPKDPDEYTVEVAGSVKAKE